MVGWARRAAKLGILTDPAHTPAALARALLTAGLEDCRAIVAENLGLPQERLVEGRLSQLAGQEFAPLNVMLLIREADWRPQPVLAPRADEEYTHRRGMITKAEVRALSLAALALAETDTAWDVGAGSGAMSIEMAGLAWRGQVYAVESDSEHVECIRENIARFGALNVMLVEGRAPEALRGLPPPRAVFIGGSGGQMGGILECISQVARPGCHVVLNVATLEHLDEARRHMRALGWLPSLTQVNIARERTLSGLTCLAPLNPVFILRAVVK